MLARVVLHAVVEYGVNDAVPDDVLVCLPELGRHLLYQRGMEKPHDLLGGGAVPGKQASVEF